MKCKVCNKEAEPEQGWFNFSGFVYPLCPEHMKEYRNFKWEKGMT